MTQTPSIWLIDDDEAILNIVARAFDKEQLSCQLKAFADTNALLFEIQQTDTLPNVLLIDYLMPGMDGLHLIERLKADPQTRELKTVLFSRNLTLAMLRKAEELDTYQVARKPDDFGSWRELVKELCTAGFFS